MPALNWVSDVEAHAIQSTLCAQYGGLPGLRDPGGLDSALARPRNSHAYGQTDLFEIAAIYAESITRNHPFNDANKRTAFALAATFLSLNGITLPPARGDEYVDLMLGLTRGEIHRREFADHLRRACTRPANG